MENPVMVFGSGGLARMALDIFEANQVVVYGFLDDDVSRHGQEINGIQVLGSTDDDGFLKLIGRKCEAFVAVEERSLRESLVELLFERRQVMPVNALHALAWLSPSASIGHGNLVGAGAILQSGARIGTHCLVHSRVVLEYDAQLEDFVQIGAGSVVGAQAEIGEGAYLGAGVVVVAGVKIGTGARVGAGAVVVDHVPARATVFGNPASPLVTKK
jgi:sugar O-acyltransferase (sialic acid O-acetyltransferase NeuD family)